MKFTIAREIEFIPEWNGNAKADQPIRVTLKYLTGPERDQILDLSFDASGKVLVRTNFEKACRLGIKRFDDFMVDGKAIVTADEFLKTPGFEDLYREIGGKIMLMNPIADESLKNSG